MSLRLLIDPDSAIDLRISSSRLQQVRSKPKLPRITAGEWNWCSLEGDRAAVRNVHDTTQCTDFAAKNRAQMVPVDGISLSTIMSSASDASCHAHVRTSLLGRFALIRRGGSRSSAVLKFVAGRSLHFRRPWEATIRLGIHSSLHESQFLRTGLARSARRYR